MKSFDYVYKFVLLQVFLFHSCFDSHEIGLEYDLFGKAGEALVFGDLLSSAGFIGFFMHLERDCMNSSFWTIFPQVFLKAFIRKAAFSSV